MLAIAVVSHWLKCSNLPKTAPEKDTQYFHDDKKYFIFLTYYRNFWIYLLRRSINTGLKTIGLWFLRKMTDLWCSLFILVFFSIHFKINLGFGMDTFMHNRNIFIQNFVRAKHYNRISLMGKDPKLTNVTNNPVGLFCNRFWNIFTKVCLWKTLVLLLFLQYHISFLKYIWRNMGRFVRNHLICTAITGTSIKGN